MRHILLTIIILLSSGFLYSQNWTVKKYVDNFGDYTNESYISNQSSGKFSNSATTNSALRVHFIVEYNSVEFQLYEYSRNHPVKAYSTTQYSIYVKDNYGNKQPYSGSIYSGGDRIHIEKNSELIALFKKSNYADFYVKENTNGIAPTYKFRVYLSGFTRAYNTVARKKEIANEKDKILQEQKRKGEIEQLKIDIQKLENEIAAQKANLTFPYKTTMRLEPQFYDGYKLSEKNIIGYLHKGTEIIVVNYIEGHFAFIYDSSPDTLYFSDSFMNELNDTDGFEEKTENIKKLQNELSTKQALIRREK